MRWLRKIIRRAAVFFRWSAMKIGEDAVSWNEAASWSSAATPIWWPAKACITPCGGNRPVKNQPGRAKGLSRRSLHSKRKFSVAA